MKKVLLLILNLVLAVFASAQHLVIKKHGCRLADSDLKAIEKILKYEARLYNNLFNTTINDSLTLVVHLYGSRSEYEKAAKDIAPDLHRTNGLYTYATDECYVVKNEGFKNTIVHEASHFFLRHNLPQYSRFLTEGIAEFFEMLEVDENGRVVFSQQDGRVKLVKKILENGSFNLASYLYAPSSQWGEKDQTQHLYSVAYSVIYFLIKKNPDILKQMLLYMQEGHSFEKAIDYSFGGYSNFESEYVYYYRKEFFKVSM